MSLMYPNGSRAARFVFGIALFGGFVLFGLAAIQVYTYHRPLPQRPPVVTIQTEAELLLGQKMVGLVELAIIEERIAARVLERSRSAAIAQTDPSND